MPNDGVSERRRAHSDDGSQIAHQQTITSKEGGLGPLTLEQVVRDYGDVCQSVTSLAYELNAPIEVDEFRTFNRCIDGDSCPSRRTSTQLGGRNIVRPFSICNSKHGFLPEAGNRDFPYTKRTKLCATSQCCHSLHRVFVAVQSSPEHPV
jgi:hypothetical protein